MQEQTEHQHLNKYHNNYEQKILTIKQQQQSTTILRRQTKMTSLKRIRNRRYKKLQQLRKQGYFTEESIKLRHPLLYYLYVGQYEFQGGYRLSEECGQNNGYSGLSVFLQKNLMNLQYKRLLSQQMGGQVQKLLEYQKNINEQQIKQLQRVCNKMNDKTNLRWNDDRNIQEEDDEECCYDKGNTMQQEQKINDNERRMKMANKMSLYQPGDEEIQQLRESCHHVKVNSEIINIDKNNRIPTVLSSSSPKLTEQDLSIQQQHLLQHCEQLFLQGKLKEHFNYSEQIDNNSNYDDMQEEEFERQQEYFNMVQEQMDNGREGYYTGVEDY